MPAVAFLLAWLSRLLMIKAGVWIVGALVYLGLYFGVQHFAIEPLVNQIRALAQGTMTGDLAQWCAFLNIDRAVSMILSAYTAAGAIAATKMALFKR